MCDFQIAVLIKTPRLLFSVFAKSTDCKSEVRTVGVGGTTNCAVVINTSTELYPHCVSSLSNHECYIVTVLGHYADLCHSCAAALGGKIINYRTVKALLSLLTYSLSDKLT